MTDFTEQEITRLKELLSDEGFNEFVQYVDIAAADYKLKAARRLIIQAWRQRAVIVVGILTLMATIWEKLTQYTGGALRWLLGQ